MPSPYFYRAHRLWAGSLAMALTLAGCDGSPELSDRDTVAPTVELMATPPAVGLDGQVALRAKLNDDVGVVRATYSVNGGQESDLPLRSAASVDTVWQLPVSAPGWHEGANTVEVSAYDRAGNRGRTWLQVQASSARFDVYYPHDQSVVYAPSVAVVEQLSGLLAGTTVSVNDGPESPVADLTALTVPLQPGDNTLRFTARKGATVVLSRSVHVTRAALPAVRSVSVAGGDACVVTTAGSAVCWGANDWGQAGTGGTDLDRVAIAPTAVVGGIAFDTVTKAPAHTCGLTSAGTAYCWGNAVWGRLGSGPAPDATMRVPAPRPVSGGLTFRSLSAGGENTCGITTGGAAYCWGNNHLGTMGNGTVGGEFGVPTRILPDLTFSAVTVADDHACALTQDGVAYCWGVVTGLGTADAGQICDVQRHDVTTYCTGTPVRVAGDLRFRTLSLGPGTSCGITAENAAFCWGYSAPGTTDPSTVAMGHPLGNADTGNSYTPVPVSGGFSFATIAVADSHACGVTISGAAYCWALVNLNGELGNGTTGGLFGGAGTSRVPVAVAGGLTFRTLSVRSGISCGVTTDNALYCWGRSIVPWLPSSTVPQRVF